MERVGKHFPLLVEVPREVPITWEEHRSLSVFGIGSFMISYPVAIQDTGSTLVLYCREDIGRVLIGNWRFVRSKVHEYQTVDLITIVISKCTGLAEGIEKRFKHLFFKR